MITHRICKSCLGILLLLAIMCIVMQPVFAAEKSKNKEKGKVAASVETPTQSHQEKVHNILAYSGGPPIDNPGEGYYYKVVPGNGKYIVNYFKNGHKENQSGWRFCGTNDCPYQQ